MEILWVARVARFDLLRAVGFLAAKITKWSTKCDRQLCRLVGYMKYSAKVRMIGRVGDPFRRSANADGAGVQPH
eukprot:134824-Alexandrium_andersonii.AAC.1